MINVKTNVLTEKGVMRPAVRTAVKGAISDINIVINGETISLEDKGNGDYFVQLGVGEDGTPIYGKVSLTITTNEYKAPAPKKKAVKEVEAIEIE